LLELREELLRDNPDSPELRDEPDLEMPEPYELLLLLLLFTDEPELPVAGDDDLTELLL
jgi:hypothetical protein